MSLRYSGSSPRQVHAIQVPLMALGHEDVETVYLVQILLNCIGLVWVTKSQTGCQDGFCLGHRMCTALNNVGYVGMTCIVTLF